MTSPKDTPLVDKVAMPATPDEVVPTEDNEEHAAIYSQDQRISDIIKCTKRLNIHDKKDAATPANIDIPKCRHDDRALMSDNKPVGVKQSATASSLHNVSAEETQVHPNRPLPVSWPEVANLTVLSSPPQPHPSTTLEVSTNSSTKLATKSDTTALTSTEPVPTIYPPRRPNIFNKRAPQRNVRWRPEVVAPQTDHVPEDIENDRDGLTLEELQEFQSENKEAMEKKTAKFLGMVSQYSWRPRVVEDLGEAFALDD